MNNTATIKTIYDPSVSGFCLPQTAGFTGFTKTGNETENTSLFNVNGNYKNGWFFYANGWRTGKTILFYALGIRNIYTGRSAAQGILILGFVRGFYWAAGASSSIFGCYMDFSSSHINTYQNDFKAAGCNILPVKE